MFLFVGGFIMLAFLAIMLFSSAVVGAVGLNGLILASAILVLMTIALIYKSKVEWKESMVSAMEKGMELERTDLFNFISVFLGAIVTFYLSIEIISVGFASVSSAVVASGLVGILATLVFPKYDAAIFCGSFVGMASGELFTSYYQLALAGLIASIVFVAGKYCFNGFGGKLGTTAFAGCVVAAVLAGQSFVPGTIPDASFGLQLGIYSILGAIITYVISVRFDNSAVISSGLVGVMSGLILPVIYPEVGATLSVMVFCASFAGMSSSERIPNELWVGISGIFCALIYIYTAPYFGGAGGKLGTTAFGSVVCIRGLAHIIDALKVKFLETGNEGQAGSQLSTE